MFCEKKLVCNLGDVRGNRQVVLVETVGGLKEKEVNVSAVLPDRSGIRVKANMISRAGEKIAIAWTKDPPSPGFEVGFSQLFSL